MQEENLKKGPWSVDEDECLKAFVAFLGDRRWDSLATVSGLKRSGKSCRLRWLNYLCPTLKRGPISFEEKQVILHLHERWGNKWSKIAQRLPGRTDNEIKNYWRSHLRKRGYQVQTTFQRPLSSVSNFDVIIPTPTSSSFSSENSGHSDQQDMLNQKDYVLIAEDQMMCGVRDNGHCTSRDPETLHNDIIISSPYESRILDWISMLPDDETEMPIACNDQQRLWLGFPSLSTDDDASDTLGGLDFLWNLDMQS